jgi:hypothetical protein
MLGCILRRLRIPTYSITNAGFVNAGGVFSGRLYVQTREHVTQPDNWFVIVNHLNERGPEKRQTRNVNPDIRSFSPVPDLHTVALQKLDSSYANLHQFEASIFSKSTKQGL